MEEEKKERETKTETKNTTIGKNRAGYGYQYTDLAEIHRYLEENNMSYYQYTERIDNDDYIMTIPIINGKEQPARRGAKIVNATLNGIKNPAQEQGSAITYARRYSLLMAFGLATDDDDAQSLTRPAISSKEEAENYVLTFGKYTGKKLKEVPQNYIQWLFDNGKDETIKTACDYLIKHITKEDVDLLGQFEDLVIRTETDRDELYRYYKVTTSADLTTEQLKDALAILKSKAIKMGLVTISSGVPYED